MGPLRIAIEVAARVLAILLGLVVGGAVALLASFVVCASIALPHGGEQAMGMVWGMLIAPIATVVGALAGATFCGIKSRRWFESRE